MAASATTEYSLLIIIGVLAAAAIGLIVALNWMSNKVRRAENRGDRAEDERDLSRVTDNELVDPAHDAGVWDRKPPKRRR